MTIIEKLRRLTEGKRKADISRQAGLKPTALSDYINKGYLPRYDIALKIARALAVPVEWFIDDAEDWPPPVLDEYNIALLSDHELLKEFCRRFRLVALRVYDDLNRAAKIDWFSIAKALLSHPVGDQVAHGIGADARLASTLTALGGDLLRFDPSIASIEFHNELPGRDVDPDELTIDRLLSRCRELETTTPGLAQVAELWSIWFLNRKQPDQADRISATIERIKKEVAALEAPNRPAAQVSRLQHHPRPNKDQRSQR
ncbi:MAG: helix-turn-helix domain-containing protein [Bacillota bacterium]